MTVLATRWRLCHQFRLPSNQISAHKSKNWGQAIHNAHVILNWLIKRMIVPESIVPDNQGRARAQRHRRTRVCHLSPDVIVDTLRFAMAGQFHPQNGVFCAVQNGTIHLDSPAHFGRYWGRDVWNGGCPLALAKTDDEGQKAGDKWCPHCWSVLLKSDDTAETNEWIFNEFSHQRSSILKARLIYVFPWKLEIRSIMRQAAQRCGSGTQMSQAAHFCKRP